MAHIDLIAIKKKINKINHYIHAVAHEVHIWIVGL